MSALSTLKNRIVTPGVRPLEVRGGLLKGLKLQLDLQHHTQVYLGLYEHELHDWVRRFSADAVTAVDVGAADGAYAMYFLKHAPVQRVYAFEPDRRAYGLLLGNLRLNNLYEDERLRVFAAAAGCTGSAMALDELLDDLPEPTLVKVDVEGGELDVLRGAERLLRRGGASWIIETHSAGLETDCAGVLRSHGLEVAIVSPGWWRFAVPEQRPMTHNRWLVAAASL